MEVRATTPAKPIKISFLPQDPGMLPPEEVQVDGSDIQDGLIGPRVRISEAPDFTAPHPDANGNYVYTLDDPRFDDAHAYVAATRALSMAQQYLGRPLDWGFSKDLGRNQLIIHPHAGANVPNAFYMSDSGSLNFFSFTDPKTGEILRSGESGDVVSHETGHAILDGIRHKYISSLSVPAAGFHESFADMNAMLCALHDPAIVKKLQEETQGDLTTPNLVARAAEGLGIAIRHITGKAEDDPNTLRTALNNYVLADQHFYPYVDKRNPDQGMGQEPHAYSNIMTGAFYDLINELYKQAAKDPSKTFAQSIAQARDTAGSILYRGMEFAPVGDPDYKSIALAMIKADQVDNGGKNRDTLEDVFKARGFVTDDDLKAFDKHEDNLPKLHLDPHATEGKENALSFLDAHRAELGVPKDQKMELLETHQGKDGETFMEFGFDKDFILSGSEFGTLEGSKAQAHGGLLLAFDKSGNLIEDSLDDVTRRKQEDIEDHLRVAVANGAAVMATPMAADNNDVVNPNGVPYLHLAEVAGPGGAVLERAPVIAG
ncbi:MAG: gluzincin family metallopeptidase [Candidatus Xenobia bacterium]